MTAVLEVKNLEVTAVKEKHESVRILDGISFELREKEILGIVGESGSGKTMTALSIMRLLPERVTITGGDIVFGKENLVRSGEGTMRRIRGKEISMVFQDPTSSLNPVISVGNQLLEMFLNHHSISRREAKKRIVEILQKVGIPDPERRYASFPHELSGGMNQRILIAMMALITRPKILIADEPTTALDVTVEKRILTLLTRLVRELGISLVLITHNLGLVAEYCDRVIVMQKGEIVETGDVFTIFETPENPYTKELLSHVPTLS